MTRDACKDSVDLHTSIVDGVTVLWFVKCRDCGGLRNPYNVSDWMHSVSDTAIGHYLLAKANGETDGFYPKVVPSAVGRE